MTPRPIADGDLAYWGDFRTEVCVFSTPAEIEDGVAPCAGIVTSADDQFGPAVRVPWTLDEIELAHLAKGGTLWLSTWGGLPMHMLEVQAP